MKRIATLTLLAIGILAVSGRTIAQTRPSDAPTSILYEITGGGIARPSYLLGTIHVSCAADIVPISAIEPFIDKTDQMLMELDLDDPAELKYIAGNVMIPNGKTIADHLSPEELAKVDAMTTSVLGYPASAVKTLKPWVLAVLIMTSPKTIGCEPEKYDLSLVQKAVEKKRPVIGLETAAAQLALFDTKPIATQAKELYKMSLDLEKWVNQLKDVRKAYRSRDVEKLFELISEQMKEDKELAERMLDKRNAAWIDKIATHVRSKSTFIAVGAGHLGGKKGLISLLRSRGYEIRPVKVAERANVGGN